jgi:hypothetical protein
LNFFDAVKEIKANRNKCIPINGSSIKWDGKSLVWDSGQEVSCITIAPNADYEVKVDLPKDVSFQEACEFLHNNAGYTAVSPKCGRSFHMYRFPDMEKIAFSDRLAVYPYACMLKSKWSICEITE